MSNVWVGSAWPLTPNPVLGSQFILDRVKRFIRCHFVFKHLAAVWQLFCLFQLWAAPVEWCIVGQQNLQHKLLAFRFFKHLRIYSQQVGVSDAERSLSSNKVSNSFYFTDTNLQSTRRSWPGNRSKTKQKTFQHENSLHPIIIKSLFIHFSSFRQLLASSFLWKSLQRLMLFGPPHWTWSLRVHRCTCKHCRLPFVWVHQIIINQ